VPLSNRAVTKLSRSSETVECSCRSPIGPENKTARRSEPCGQSGGPWLAKEATPRIVSRVPRYACRCRQVPPIRSLGGYEWRAGLGGGLKLIRSARLAKWEHRLIKNESPSFKRNWSAEAPRDHQCGFVSAGHLSKVAYQASVAKTPLTACTQAAYGGLFVRFTRQPRGMALRGLRLRVES